MNIFIKYTVWSYLFASIARYAGNHDNLILLYCAIGLAYWIIMIEFPLYKKIEDMEDVDG